LKRHVSARFVHNPFLLPARRSYQIARPHRERTTILFVLQGESYVKNTVIESGVLFKDYMYEDDYFIQYYDSDDENWEPRQL